MKSVPKKNSLTIKILNAYDKERNIEMGCADYRISSVCHTHCSWGYVLHGTQLEKKSRSNKWARFLCLYKFHLYFMCFIIFLYLFLLILNYLSYLCRIIETIKTYYYYHEKDIFSFFDDGFI